MSEKELEKRRAEEYEMQLFGLHSRTVFAAIEQKINQNIDLRCKQMFISIDKKYNPDVLAKENLRKNIKLLRKTYRENTKPHLKTIEKIVNKFICIPSNVLLDEDKLQATQYTDEEFYMLDVRLKNLQQYAKRVTVFNTALKQEYEITDKIRESEELAKKLCEITDKALLAKKINNKSLRAIEKCKGLQESLDSIKPQVKRDIYNPRINERDLEQIIID
ncbi:uncharacterized protein LOC131662806 [Phymastichus coffea]|uniref:uncharacterized protein LOC131662806 n=1 Tax=Phymastichus coffea TaxID=108790 RepID=UPI00273B2F35|nr:uncharacterized protein LOC131662806 [Phymastichus coffea]